MRKSIREITPFPIRPGMLLGRRYKVDRPLGRGGCGIVFAAVDNDTLELVALKTFRDEFLGSPAQRKAFEKEARLWVSFGHHAFVLRARGVESFNGRLFLVMEFIAPDEMERVTLMDHIRSAGAPLPIGRCLDWSIQFCWGMEHAVRHGLHCHRDIKPQNILISRGTTVKIADFGVASVKELQLDGDVSCKQSELHVGDGPVALRASCSMSRTICGTPGYMAPEVYQGEGADMLSDIYSFGLVLWQMAAGSPDPPFAPERWVDVEEYPMSRNTFRILTTHSCAS